MSLSLLIFGINKILEVAKLLRNKLHVSLIPHLQFDCSITLPYWDWTRYAHAPFTAPLWSESLLGGDGSASNGRCVSTGPFAQWKVQPNNTCLQRHFSGTMPSAAVVNQTILTPLASFSQFEMTVRTTLHNGPLCTVGGTMCSALSSNAPEYWLFSGFTDSIWNRFQNISTAHRDVLFSSITTPLTGSGGTASPSDYVNNRQLPGGVCVEYQTDLLPVSTAVPTTANTGIVIGGHTTTAPSVGVGGVGDIVIGGNSEEVEDVQHDDDDLLDEADEEEDLLWSL